MYVMEVYLMLKSLAQNFKCELFKSKNFGTQKNFQVITCAFGPKEASVQLNNSPYSAISRKLEITFDGSS